MPAWPDKEEALLKEFLHQMGYAPHQWGYPAMLRHFQRFVSKRKRPLAQDTLRSWLTAGAAQASVPFVIERAVFVKRFLDWLVQRGIVAENPFTQLREHYNCQSTAAIARALLDPQPAKALEARRPQPRYATWAHSFVSMSSECGVWAIAIATMTASSASTGICNTSRGLRPSPLRSSPVTTSRQRHLRRKS